MNSNWKQFLWPNYTIHKPEENSTVCHFIIFYHLSYSLAWCQLTSLRMNREFSGVASNMIITARWLLLGHHELSSRGLSVEQEDTQIHRKFVSAFCCVSVYHFRLPAIGEAFPLLKLFPSHSISAISPPDWQGFQHDVVEMVPEPIQKTSETMSPAMSFQHANVVGEYEKKHRIFYRHLSFIVLFRFWVLNKETDNCTENWELLYH